MEVTGPWRDMELFWLVDGRGVAVASHDIS